MGFSFRFFTWERSLERQVEPALPLSARSSGRQRLGAPPTGGDTHCRAFTPPPALVRSQKDLQDPGALLRVAHPPASGILPFAARKGGDSPPTARMPPRRRPALANPCQPIDKKGNGNSRSPVTAGSWPHKTAPPERGCAAPGLLCHENLRESAIPQVPTQCKPDKQE